MACRESLSESLVGVRFLYDFGMALGQSWSALEPSCRSSVFGSLTCPRLSGWGDNWPGWLAGQREQAMGMLNTPVGLVGVLSHAMSDCLVGFFGGRTPF